MSHRSASDGSTRGSAGMEVEEDEEDFLPAIPESLLHPRHPGAAAPEEEEEEKTRLQKRPRSPLECDEVKDGEPNAIELLIAEGYPAASLYERSYRHDRSVCDIGVVQDEMGALLITIDVSGTLRTWRKLPRGVFFMSERHGLFPQIPTATESGAVDNRESVIAAEHFILVDPLTSSLFVVRTTPHVELAAGVVMVEVEVRRISPALMAVEARISFQFTAALRSSGKSTSCWEESVTRRPFLLHHEYQPYIVFFTAEPNGAAGAVLMSCAAERAWRTGAAAASVLVPSVSLSTANPVVCCQQHRPSGLVVLVDEKGIMDYAQVVARPGENGRIVASLQVVAGAPPRGSADPMMLRDWIVFERRQKTGFFTLLRDARNHANAGRVMLPLGVGFSPTGQYFAVASALLREGGVCVCCHLFEFASGAFLCRGEAEETTTMSLRSASDMQAALQAMRGAVFNVVVENAVRKAPQGGAGGVWVFLPEITLSTVHERQVRGRRVFVFRAAPEPTATTTTTRGEGDLMRGTVSCAATALTPFHMEQLLRPIGDMENNIREADLPVIPPPQSSLPVNVSLSAAPCAHRHFAAPLTLLRLTVSASQALKNLVMQSPLGSALSQEDVKRLFAVPSSAAIAAAGLNGLSGSVDPTLCTTSLSGAALLLYTKYEAPLDSIPLMTENGSDDSSGDANAAMTERVRRERLLLELHQKRDFDCGDLQQLQSSVQRVVPRGAVEEGEEQQGGDEIVHTKHNDSETDSAVEERRVQHIIASASSCPVKWGNVVTRVLIVVSCFGTITVCLLPQISPKAVANFIGLAREGFYDGLTFHRVVPGFMIQGGCPLGDGTGGKSIFGDTFEDEGLNVMEFFSYPTVYWLCMANRGPNTNESQFFITVGEVAPWLNGKHTVFGFVVGGKQLVQAIVQMARDADEKPVTPVVIERVVVKEGSMDE